MCVAVSIPLCGIGLLILEFDGFSRLKYDNMTYFKWSFKKNFLQFYWCWCFSSFISYTTLFKTCHIIKCFV